MSIKFRKESDLESYDLEEDNFENIQLNPEELKDSLYEQDQKITQHDLNRDKNIDRTQKDHASHQQNYTDTHKSAGPASSPNNLAQRLDQDLSVQGTQDRFQQQSNQNRAIGNQNMEEQQQDQERGNVA